MSGALALWDDVAALARLASTQVDDIAGQAAKVGSKTAGIIIDDAAVTRSPTAWATFIKNLAHACGRCFIKF